MSCETRNRQSALFAFAISILLAFFTIACVAPSAALADEPAAKSGLVKEGGSIHYYDSGTLVTSSWKTVGSAKYYFDAKGNAVCGKSAKVGSSYWIFSDAGKLLMPSSSKYVELTGGLYYVSKKGHPAKTGWYLEGDNLRYVAASGKVARSKTVDGIKFTKNAVASKDSYTALKVYCMKMVARVTKPSMSKSQKLLALWNNTQLDRAFVNSMEPKDVGTNGWMQRCAKKMAYSNGLECFGIATLFAAFSYEIGCDPVVYALPAVHAFVEIDGRYYDNMLATAGASQPKLGKKDFKTYKMTSWRDTTNNHAAKKSSTAKKSKKAGLVKSKGSYYFYVKGKALKKKWKTYKGSRYYFTSSGKAAVGSVKIKGTYYVFSSKGKLLKGKSTRLKKVKGVTYRVKASGKAAKGWNSAKTKYYLANGTVARGVHVISGKLYAASSSGVYDAAKTAELRAAAQVNSDVTPLVELLGTPKSVRIQASCYYLDGITGDDAVYVYDNIVLYALIDDSTGTRYFYSAESR